ncbi:hypothetical protein C8R21_11263 [Nitrosospira multiformis]|uniref:Uncharacterized protein n=1 Tax=Nitrosospira multiformis TaxID=1231 RepID=A0A2T5IB21_9PROT|nr:hypothetical protein [Nitrosospira multiformis]PTQ81018.1 hypothetical protein C8R21_11263 [Nitrosospira multiformis]
MNLPLGREFDNRNVKTRNRYDEEHMREISRTEDRFMGCYRQIHMLLKRAGWQPGKNQAYRLRTDPLALPRT